MIKYFLTLIFISLITLQGQELLKDASFKKADKYWFMKKTNEYKQVKESFKKGIFSTETKHSSEAPYYFLLSQTKLSVGKYYRFTFSIKAKGEGDLSVCYRNINDVFNKKPGKKGRKLAIMGLKQTFSPDNTWQTYECYFQAQENPTSGYIDCLCLMMGAYTGDIQFKDLSLEEAQNPPEIKNVKFGLIQKK
ncbi:hypothetical protein LNTAR_17758 [Lentisphaera araneosa HTCC2155]|jgi:hypothetical protein|uniref:CBM-cenC domain-containing protein n=1 Tax=Lentisphaera araneosa HTCC2155 TaxID=313628 RepID=A6DFP0_9BACT|nr:hypothetical protein [Lentisphaera araneosa]EDM29620.1 hypothetical protein LNTAR_17758 [Lentisphaera araneosa HTCC2155]